MTQTALKSAPKPSARNIPSKATIPPPAETATMAARAATAPTTVNHCRKARSRGKNMSLHSKPMAVTKSVSSGKRAGRSFSNGRAESGATEMAVMIAPMVLPLCSQAQYAGGLCLACAPGPGPQLCIPERGAKQRLPLCPQYRLIYCKSRKGLLGICYQMIHRGVHVLQQHIGENTNANDQHRHAQQYGNLARVKPLASQPAHGF